MHTIVIHSLCYTHSEYLCFPPYIVIHTVYMATRHLEWNALQYYYSHVHSHTPWGNLATHRFKDHQIQTRSDRGTEPCTGSKTIRSKPVQTGALSLAQVQRSSDPNPFRQGNRTGSSDLGQGDVCCLSPFNNALNSIASRWQQLCKHYLVAVIKMDGCQLLHELKLDTNVLKSFMLGHIL